ncbi:MAG: hypothetical protein JRF34_02050 [Deltaproteobacteria bacterium]|nr:hypothetical protein [Deltaproteobacteria bacterium]
MRNIWVKSRLLSCRLLAVVLIVLWAVPYFFTVHASMASDSSSAGNPDLGVLVGSWQRTDGSYSIRVSDIKTDGQVKAEYFNPKPIHVAEATVSTQKDLMKLFIRFQDKGYEGSAYTLYYYAEKDALLGFYYQAAMDKTFEVIFLRKK